MLALNTLRGIRVVSAPHILDAATWPAHVTALRIAPDDIFAIAATEADAAEVEAADPHSIVVDETGFVGCWLDQQELEHITRHIEWHAPSHRPALVQGYVAGVPAKMWLTNELSLLLCASPYAAELSERIS
ncbi:MAG: hypothetical protein WCK14_06330 [Actinomycetota bacterium]